MNLEAASSNACVEQHAINESMSLPVDMRPSSLVCHNNNSNPSTGHGRNIASDVAKLKREIKACAEQNACVTACGDVPLVRVSVIGRAIRVFGAWYALCSMCGALCRVTASMRFGEHICCLKCDHAMLGRKQDIERHERLRPRVSPMLCRYCGKPRPEDSKGKWRTMPAPVDDEGPNRDVPPPLRTVTYCPYHFRAWLPSAHTALTTQVIFSHLVVNAKPIFEVNHTVSICRYCGEKHPGIGATSERWRSLPAPLDREGDNASLIPTQRTVTYCPKHYKSWLGSCHKVLENKEIFASIAANKKPKTLSVLSARGRGCGCKRARGRGRALRSD